jgi:ABC-type Fe3+-hydroxamate transport system substrate-binding protein
VRVVSLVPSVTETLIGWGVEPVAVTRFCEQPGLLAVGGTKDPDVAAIVALRPDLVVVNDEENRAEDAAALEAAGLALHVTRVRGMADVAPALDALARAVGIAYDPAETNEQPALPMRVRAFVPIWRRPWMTLNADTYGSSLLAATGVANVYADDGERYPTVTLADAARRAPDVVLAPSEPYPFAARHAVELEQVAPVELIDGRDLFWWGGRTPGALVRLRDRLQALGS